MKKTIIIGLLVTLLMAMYVTAPPSPYPMYGHVEWNAQLLSGTRIQLTNQNTAHVEMVVTNGDGNWQADVGNWASYGQVVEIKALDGCGTADTCAKTVTVGIAPNADYARVDLSLTGTLSCPSVSCPTCSGGGGSSCSETYCNSKYPPDVCEERTCPAPVYTKTRCDYLFPSEDQTCPDPVTCPEEKVCPVDGEECPEAPEGLTSGQVLVFILSLVGIGAGGAFAGQQLTKDRITRVKGVTYRVAVERDGDVREEHRHPGLRNYHSINTSHKEEHERHPKGEKFPLYEKDSEGVYVYKG